MAIRIPPPPRSWIDSIQDIRLRKEVAIWLQLIQSKLTSAAQVLWFQIDFTGSDLEDLEKRQHNTLQFQRQSISGNYQALVKDTTIFANASAGALTVTLPDATDAVGPINIKKIDSSGNFVSVDTLVGQTIDGGASFVLELQDETITVEPDGANWWIV